jgi:hypothetical protein
VGVGFQAVSARDRRPTGGCYRKDAPCLGPSPSSPRLGRNHGLTHLRAALCCCLQGEPEPFGVPELFAIINPSAELLCNGLALGFGGDSQVRTTRDNSPALIPVACTQTSRLLPSMP